MSKFNNKLSQVYKLKYLNFKYYNVAEVHIRKYEDFLFTTAFISNSRSPLAGIIDYYLRLQ